MRNDNPDKRGTVSKQQRREDADAPPWRSEEPAPVDVARFGRNLSEIIAKAMKASSR
jgi:hypothetical protein